jgi:hypothetical protein
MNHGGAEVRVLCFLASALELLSQVGILFAFPQERERHPGSLHTWPQPRPAPPEEHSQRDVVDWELASWAAFV